MAQISIEIADEDLPTAQNIIGQLNDALAAAKPAEAAAPTGEPPFGKGKEKNPMGSLSDLGAELEAGDKLPRP